MTRCGHSMAMRRSRTTAVCVAQLKLLSDHTRFAVVRELMSHDCTFDGLTRTLGVEPTLLSHHLKLLREAGFVARTRDGRMATYRIADKRLVTGTADVIQLGCCTLNMSGDL